MNMNKIKFLILAIILFGCFALKVDALEVNDIIDGTLIVAEYEHDYVGENICAEDSIQRILYLAGMILIIAKLVVPLILIALGTMDLYKAVIGKDEKVLFNSLKSLGLRIALGIFIFFIPNLVNWAFDLYYETAGGDNNKQCINCLLDIDTCNVSTS